ncbi:MAG TPA: FAD-dependent oxidoreductase [Thermoanaerobaculia bacterium]|nr:FAD-dependent oxidoreductase [Thermoanaerobaculia bacterium]
METAGAGTRADVVVVGAGVVGVSCALELARRGRAVTVLERDRVGAACSSGNAGLLTPSVSVPLPSPGLFPKALGWLFDPASPLYIEPRLDWGLARWILGFLRATTWSRYERGARALVELSIASCASWRELAERGPDRFDYRPTGLLQVYETEASLVAARPKVELVGRLGVPFETWTAEEVREREPALRGPVGGAYFYPGDAHCEPFEAVIALAAEARRAGVEFVEEAEVFGFGGRTERLESAETTRGRFAAEQFVLATGAWSQRLGRRFGLRVPVLGAKGYTVLIPPIETMPRRALQLFDRKLALTPHSTRLRISGTLELVDEDLSITRSRVEAILAGARAALPLPEPLEPLEIWRGLRPTTPDGLPMIGRARGRSNLWLATGHQMTGLKTAPATGRLLAELLTGEAPSFDPGPFRADRY